MRILFVILPIALGGCSGQAPADNASNAVVKAPPVPTEIFGGVDLLKPVEVSGTASFNWKLVLAPGDITYTGEPAPDPAPEPWYPVSPVIAGGKASWPTHDSSGRKTLLTLTADECRQHGKTWPLTATLEIDGRTLRGCAGAKPPEVPAG